MNEEIFNSVVIKILEDESLLNARTIRNLCFCHSKFAFNRQKELEQNSDKYFKRSQKKLLRLNDQFYEMIVPVLRQKMAEFRPLDLIGISFGALRPQVKKLEVNRQMFQLNLDIMRHLAERIKNQGSLNSSEIQEERRKAYFQIAKINKRLKVGDKLKM